MSGYPTHDAKEYCQKYGHKWYTAVYDDGTSFHFCSTCQAKKPKTVDLKITSRTDAGPIMGGN